MNSFCDFCGEVITNFHNSVEDNKIFFKIYNDLEKKQKKEIKGFFKRLFFYPELPKKLQNGSNLIFCNKEHHESFLREFALESKEEVNGE